MSEETLSVSVQGMEEIAKDLQLLARKYPDKAGELLVKEAREIRKEVAKEVRNRKKSYKTSKQPLERAGKYSVSQPQSYGAAQYVEIKAKQPHFHLVEHGHKLILRGRSMGFVEGYHMMDNNVKKHREKMPETAGKMLDELLKEAGF